MSAISREEVAKLATLARIELSPEELKQRSEQFDESVYEVLTRESWLESKRIEGGTASGALAAQIGLAGETLAAVEARVLEERS